jgi:methylated-DNA-protein-cysteine methyltransferase related protein
MARSAAYARIKTDVLAIVRGVPPGKIVTFDAIGQHLVVMPRHVAYILSALTDSERELVPWHRVVAKGGAIGRGPHRDAQFAKLVREGVSVSPAGIVQDMERTVVALLDLKSLGTAGAVLPQPAPLRAPTSRSRGMKDRPC